MSTPTERNSNAYTSGGRRWSLRARGSSSVSTKRAYSAYCSPNAPIRIFPTVESGAAQQLADPVEQHRAERERGADRDDVRAGEALEREARTGLGAGRLRERERAVGQPGVASQPHHRQAFALDRVLLVEQDADPRKGQARDVDELDEVRVADVDPLDHVVDGLQQDGEVLGDPRIRFRRGCGAQRLGGAERRLADAVAPSLAIVAGICVGLRQAEVRGGLGGCQDVERDDGLGKLIAARNPGRFHSVQLPTFQKSLTDWAGLTPCRSLFQALTFARHTIVWNGSTSPRRRSSCAYRVLRALRS